MSGGSPINAFDETYLPPPKLPNAVPGGNGRGKVWTWHCSECKRPLTTTNPPFAMWCAVCYVAVYNDQGKIIAVVEEPYA